jgi:hypothetical protein
MDLELDVSFLFLLRNKQPASLALTAPILGCDLFREPPLGTISFVLLTFQVARSNMQNIGSKPYTARVKQWRAERLAAAFPEYDAAILIQYSNNTSLQESKEEIENA